ncbi:MAG: hypothetical protein JWQ96_1498 [Segetibacter sp.]|nr:hypothetical protein [Segetibacter sp.]
MKKYIIFSLSVLMLTACTKDIERFNEQTKAAANVPAASLFSNGVRNLIDAITTPNVNINVFRMTVQHWATTTYQDEPQYDFNTRAIPQTWWRIMYRDVLVDLQEAKRLIPSDITITDATKKNQIAITDIMQVYTYSVLVNTFGDVPYTQALDYNVLFPKYDDAKTIYDDLLVRLDADIAALNTAGNAFNADADLIYGSVAAGSRVAAWKKFANSLKIKLAMTIADVDAAKAKTAVEQASPNAFTSADDNAEFQYQGKTPNNNPIWADLIQSKRQDFVAASTIVTRMQALNDPRIPLFFKPNDAGVYVGGSVGSNNTFPLFAKPSDAVAEIDAPSLLLSYDEIEFYRAEAVERGFNVGGTAMSHYNNAVTASIIYWGGTQAQANAYLLNTGVNYLTAPGTYKQKIGVQKWLALYNRPYDAWVEVRRLDSPTLPAPTGAKSGYPNRLTYPTNEQTLNNSSYTSASAKIGGDNVETKLFWDKF